MNYIRSKIEAIKKSALGLLATYAVVMVFLSAIIQHQFLVMFSIISTLILAVLYVFWLWFKENTSADFRALSEELQEDGIKFVQEVKVKVIDFQRSTVFEVSLDNGKTWQHFSASEEVAHCGSLESRKMYSGCWITFDTIRNVYYLFG